MSADEDCLPSGELFNHPVFHDRILVLNAESTERKDVGSVVLDGSLRSFQAILDKFERAIGVRERSPCAEEDEPCQVYVCAGVLAKASPFFHRLFAPGRFQEGHRERVDLWIQPGQQARCVTVLGWMHDPENLVVADDWSLEEVVCHLTLCDLFQFRRGVARCLERLAALVLPTKDSLADALAIRALPILAHWDALPEHAALLAAIRACLACFRDTTNPFLGPPLISLPAVLLALAIESLPCRLSALEVLWWGFWTWRKRGAGRDTPLQDMAQIINQLRFEWMQGSFLTQVVLPAVQARPGLRDLRVLAANRSKGMVTLEQRVQEAMRVAGQSDDFFGRCALRNPGVAWLARPVRPTSPTWAELTFAANDFMRAGVLAVCAGPLLLCIVPERRERSMVFELVTHEWMADLPAEALLKLTVEISCDGEEPYRHRGTPWKIYTLDDEHSRIRMHEAEYEPLARPETNCVIRLRADANELKRKS